MRSPFGIDLSATSHAKLASESVRIRQDCSTFWMMIDLKTSRLQCPVRRRPSPQRDYQTAGEFGRRGPALAPLCSRSHAQAAASATTGFASLLSRAAA
jgi:hypothetical protein